MTPRKTQFPKSHGCKPAEPPFCRVETMGFPTALNPKALAFKHCRVVQESPEWPWGPLSTTQGPPHSNQGAGASLGSHWVPRAHAVSLRTVAVCKTNNQRSWLIHGDILLWFVLFGGSHLEVLRADSGLCAWICDPQSSGNQMQCRGQTLHPPPLRSLVY